MGRKIAAIFAGQGAQYPGMGKSLYETSAAARAVFEAAGDKITRDCFEATQEELNQTDVTQPAVYTVDMAAWAAFAEALGIATNSCSGHGVGEAAQGGEVAQSRAAAQSGETVQNREAVQRGETAQSGVLVSEPVDIVGMAGFSLGEYAAFTAAGVLPDVATGIELIKERGRLMAAAGRHEDGSPRGAMAAVLGARDDILELVEAARGSWVLEAVNYNAPTQTAIAGDAEAIEAFASAAKASGKRIRVMPLPVSTAFHSPIMTPASEGIREAASKIAFGAPAYEVYLDMTAGALSAYIEEADGGAAEEPDFSDIVPRIMAEQVKRPVKWQQITEALAAAGAEIIVEFGPGKTLTGLAKKTAPDVTAVNVQDAETLAAAIEAIVK